MSESSKKRWVYPLTSGNQTVVAYEMVSFRIDATDSAWCVVYFAWDASTTKLKVYVSYRKGPDNTTWLGRLPAM